jgi:hypothetical protein
MRVLINNEVVDIEVNDQPWTPQVSYSELVEQLIRERYTLGQELATLRQKDTKPEEFAEYNAYAEQCKAKAKQLLGGQ